MPGPSPPQPAPAPSAQRAFWAGPWPPRIVAAMLAVMHLALVAAAMPHSERWYISPDDGDAYRYGRAVAEHGLPFLEASDFAPPGVSNLTLFQPTGTFRAFDAHYASVRPPLMYYLAAPAAALGHEALFVWMDVLALLSLAAAYALMERIGGGWAAALGLGLYAFQAPTLYWEWFPRSNVLAVGMLALALRLLLARRPWWQAAGAATLALLTLARFEMIPLVGILAIGWLAANARRWRERRAALLAVALGFAAGALVVGLISFLAYDTVNLLFVQSGGNGAGATPVVASPLEAQYEAYVQFFLASVVGLTCGFLARRARWPVWPLGAGTLAVSFVLLSGSYSPQPILLLQSLTRYLLVVGFAGAVGLAAFLADARPAILAAAGAAVLLAGVAGAATAIGSDGLEATRDYTREQLELVRAVDRLAPDAILVGEYEQNAFPHHAVLHPDRIADKARQRLATVDAVHELLQQGHAVVGDLKHGSQYRFWIDLDPRMTAQVGPDGVLWSAALRTPA